MSNCVVNIFKNTVSCFGKKIAIADEQRKFTFEEVDYFANKIAKKLEMEKSMIGVMAHRDTFTIPIFLGVAYSGRCYVPIDPNMPIEKMQKIICNAGISVVLSCNLEEQETIESIGPRFIDVSYIFSDLRNKERYLIKEYENQELLYLIYTSGSMGVPKGVAKSYKSMENFMKAYKAEFTFDEYTVIGNQTPFYFDASAKDIYMMVACGATLEILPTALFSFPVRLIEYMNNRKINFISWVPSALTIVTTLNTFSEIIPKYLEKVFFVGEVFPIKHLNKWMEALPNVEFVNLYGSSEISGISCYYRIKEKIEKEDVIPLGKALSNCDVALVHENRCITTPNQIGEIYVASSALAEGYYGDFEKTEKSFVINDFGNGKKRYYRTGDMAKWNEDGDLVFVARCDYQIKHMGHRIELGEIETVAMNIEEVVKCCCLYDNTKNKIILYVQLEDESKLTAKELRSQLKLLLSDYMVPHHVKCMERLPMNANGKIDRAYLQKALN